MTRVVNVDMTVRTNDCAKAFDKFFKKYPELGYWREMFEHMAENGEDFFSDDFFADGERNYRWRYALHLVIDENYVYMAVIERA